MNHKLKQIHHLITDIDDAKKQKELDPQAFQALLNEEQLTFDYLPGTQLYLFQKKQMFRNNTDTAMLGHFLEIKEGESVLDIGTNNGALLLYASLSKANLFIGVELQEEACELARYNLSLHHIDANIIHCDIKDVHDLKADVIISNPPYFKGPDNRVEMTSRQIARHEFFLSLETLIASIHELISENGRCYIVHRADRITDIIHLFQQYHMKVKKIQFIYDEAKTEARSVLVEARRHSKSGCKVLNPIILTR